MSTSVIVVGSINADVIAAVPARAGAGETVLATGLVRRSGGKGANQAAAAARAGANTRLIAAVGDDPEGVVQRAELARDGVDVADVVTISGLPTGIAMIVVTPDGENSITVAAGANAVLDSETVIAALDAGARPTLVVLQTEVAVPLIESVAGWCLTNRVRYILNDGPYIELPARVLAGADPLVVNEHEARAVCLAGGIPAEDSGLALAVLRAAGARSAVVTRGSQGTQVATETQAIVVPPTPAAVLVDTTGAGDTFLGTMAAALVAGAELPAAVRAASVAASDSVSWHGARPPRP